MGWFHSDWKLAVLLFLLGTSSSWINGKCIKAFSIGAVVNESVGCCTKSTGMTIKWIHLSKEQLGETMIKKGPNLSDNWANMNVYIRTRRFLFFPFFLSSLMFFLSLVATFCVSRLLRKRWKGKREIIRSLVAKSKATREKRNDRKLIKAP